MDETNSEPDLSPIPNDAERRRSSWLAGGGLVGAVLASACCLVPLLLVTFGVSGAWIANLTALEPYKPYVAAAALTLIVAGFWRVYFKSPQPCEDGSYCARPQSPRITRWILWFGTILVALSLTIGWWAPLFY
jgi:mercuric ion transport protein